MQGKLPEGLVLHQIYKANQIFALVKLNGLDTPPLLGCQVGSKKLRVLTNFAIAY